MQEKTWAEVAFRVRKILGNRKKKHEKAATIQCFDAYVGETYKVTNSNDMVGNEDEINFHPSMQTQQARIARQKEMKVGSQNTCEKVEVSQTETDQGSPSPLEMESYQSPPEAKIRKRIRTLNTLQRQWYIFKSSSTGKQMKIL